MPTDTHLHQTQTYAVQPMLENEKNFLSSISETDQILPHADFKTIVSLALAASIKMPTFKNRILFFIDGSDKIY